MDTTYTSLSPEKPQKNSNMIISTVAQLLKLFPPAMFDFLPANSVFSVFVAITPHVKKVNEIGNIKEME